MENTSIFNNLRELLSLLSKLTYNITSVSAPLHNSFQEISLDKLLSNDMEEFSKLDKIFFELMLTDDLIDQLIDVEMDICKVINTLKKQLKHI